jgi:hypothetical protein
VKRKGVVARRGPKEAWSIDHVEVFDLQLGAFIAPLEPPRGPPPNAGLSLTPDASQLLVADFGAQSVYVLILIPALASPRRWVVFLASQARDLHGWRRPAHKQLLSV